MAREPHERIIFDDASYYDYGCDLAVEDLMDVRGLTEDEVRWEYSDSDLFDHAMWLMNQDFELQIDALERYFGGRSSILSSASSERGGNPIMVHGSIGRWNGANVGTSFFDNLEDVLFGSESPFRDCDFQKVWDENGRLYIRGAHHDGSVTVELRQLSDAGIDAKEAIEDAAHAWSDEPFEANGKTYDGSDRSVDEALRDLWESTEPPRYAERAFGSPAEEWDEPEQEADGHDLGGEEPDKGSSTDRLPDLQTGKWRVHLVYEGDHYGRDGSLTYGDAEGDAYPYIGQRINDCRIYGHGLPLVEFYDTSQNPIELPGGQHVSSYYMSTLLGMDDFSDDIADVGALSLDGAVPAWTVSGDDLKAVSDYLHEARDACEASSSREQESLETDIAAFSESARESSEPDREHDIGGDAR